MLFTRPPVVQPLLLATRDAARALGISERKLADLKSSGEIAHVRIGRAVRFAVTDLQAYIDSKKATGVTIDL